MRSPLSDRVRNVEALDRLGRGGRRAALRLFGPLDSAVLLLNGKRAFPPIHLRREVGPLTTFESAAGEFAALLAVLGRMKPRSRILDVGCGCGSVAIAIRDRLSPSGRYYGLEVDRRAIEWCSRHLANERFRFQHHDYWNALYNPAGTRFLPLALGNAEADIVLMKSVLTHVLPEDATFYFEETARVLRPSGTALITVYLYEASDAVVTELCPHDAGNYRYRRKAAPESVIAFKREWLAEQISRAGLSFDLHPGFWRTSDFGGDSGGATHQDLLVVRRA